MPSTSAKQHKFMTAIAHSPSFAKKVGVPMSVGKDFTEADKGRKFSKGGDMATKNLFKGKETMKEELAEAKAIKSGKITPMQYAKGEKSEGVHKMAKGGFARVAGGKLPSGFKGVKGSAVKSGLDAGNKSADGIAQRGKTRGDNIVMKSRGGKC